MKAKKVRDWFYGCDSAVAYALGISPVSVFRWMQSGKVPLLRQYQIQIATHGKLRADKAAIRNSDWRVRYRSHKKGVV